VKLIILIIIFFSVSVNGATFNELAKKITKHSSVEEIEFRSKALEEAGKVGGSWGDPKFKIQAKNFPKDSLKNDETPMTGIEFGVSQKISLTPKYGNIQNSYRARAKAKKHSSEDKKQQLIKSLWEMVIRQKQLSDELKILKENFIWINKILKVTKKLYANGKTSQQALLELQIRKSEIEGAISNISFDLSQIDDSLTYLAGSRKEKLDYSTVPWELLNRKANKKRDLKELAYKQGVVSSQYELSASKLNYVPDMTFSLGITKRANIDNKGDFVGASVSFPLPFSGQKYAMKEKAVQNRYASIKRLKTYRESKRRDVAILGKEILKLNAELKILINKTIKFAKNSRLITSKSYGLGNSSYLELLQSELKLQKILLKKIMLKSKIDFKIVTLKYLKGEPLYE